MNRLSDEDVDRVARSVVALSAAVIAGPIILIICAWGRANRSR